MNSMARHRNQRPLFEFERSGQSSARPSADHKPDLNHLSVARNGNSNNNNSISSNYNRNRSNTNTSASLDFIDLKSLQKNPVPSVSSSFDNKIFSLNQKKNKRSQIHIPNRTFDNLFLVDLLNTSKFDQITEINASSQNLTEIDISTLKQLTIVKNADFSDNSLPLEPFSVLQNLEELDMSCNGLKNFDFDKCEREYMDLDDDGRAWNSLHTLNLSHNMCSNMISDLQLIPLLSNLNLSSNSITNLPSNLMYFTCLTSLDLSNNNLNSDSSLFSLATIPSLQILNLDYNGLVRIPKFQFGFEALVKISLKSNFFEEADDFNSLADLLTLQEVNIIGNPITIKGPKYLAPAQKAFASAKIELICHSTTQPLKSTIYGNFRSVPVDPLALPFFTRAHRRALNENIDKKPPVRGSQKVPPLNLDTKANNSTSANNNETQNSNTTNNTNNNNDDVFMTAFTSKADDVKPKNTENDFLKNDSTEKNEMLQRIQAKMLMNMNANSQQKPELDFSIPTIQRPRIPLTFEEEEPSQTNFWSEIPFVQEERRKAISNQIGADYSRVFNQLQFIVLHPESRPGNLNKLIKPKKDDTNDEGEFDGIYYSNDNYVYNEFLNKEYHEGDEIDEIQDILQNRNQEERNQSRKRLNNRARLGPTPIPFARRSPRAGTVPPPTPPYIAQNCVDEEENNKLTSEEISEMIQGMDDMLLSVEKEFQDADDERLAEKRRQLREKNRRKKVKRNGRNSGFNDDYETDSDDDDDFDDESGDRFARLNKQYEVIRADLVRTLTES